MEKIQFAFLHYLELGIFVASCYGFGIWITRLDRAFRELDRIFLISLAICVGMGVFIVGLQALGILGLLNKSWVTILLMAGLVSFIAYWIPIPVRLAENSAKASKSETPSNGQAHWIFPCLLALIAVDLFPLPLHPPVDWDELMYHLPHARDWAASGRLTVNEWLRYPLFPYNFNLLYAAGLTYDDEIFSHMANALAGWLVAIGLFRLADRHFGRAVASISALLFVCLALGQFGGAMADLGLTLFLFFGFSCVFLWQRKGNFSFLCVAAFLIGIAAGIKYQALTFLPLLAAVVLFKERRPLHLLALLVLFAIPCAYWYIRNYMISGDPFHPMGGSLFGYWNWNAGDMALQVADIQHSKNWPKPYIWPALAALLIRSKFADPPFRAALIFSLYAFIVWIFTSHYARYLMPAYPMMALLAAVVLHHLHANLASRFSDNPKLKFGVIASVENIFAALFTVLLGAIVIQSFAAEWQTIQTTSEGRSSYLRSQIKSYELAEFLQSHPEYHPVQIDLESDLYYLPVNTIGEVFGPGRYRDFDHLSAQDLAKRLKSFNANAILLPNKSEESKRIMGAKDFPEYFVTLKKSNDVNLFALR